MRDKYFQPFRKLNGKFANVWVYALERNKLQQRNCDIVHWFWNNKQYFVF